MIGIDDVRAAAAAISGVVARTPTVRAASLGARLGCELLLKLETLHPTGSFKERGAANRLARLSPAEAAAGVVAMSAGNHAQGVAANAARLGVPATIVMPRHTPFTKAARTEALGARVVLHGDTLSEAEEHARGMAAAPGGPVLVHPYDDPLVMAGQGTAGLELLADAGEPPDVVLVPIGGGGLISGVATAVKALSPRTEVVGVQAALYPSMVRVLRGEDPGGGGPTLAEGIAVKAPGLLTREVVRARVDDILLVEEPAIEAAVDLVATEQRLVAEGAGAAGIAALLSYPERFAGRRVATILCGGNIDPRVLSTVLMRGLVRGGRLVQLRIGLQDVPGALSRIAALLGDCGANIVEVSHRRLLQHVPVRAAELDAVVETRDAAHAAQVIERLRAGGHRVEMLGSVS
jgi:threonine dehydratase